MKKTKAGKASKTKTASSRAGKSMQQQQGGQQGGQQGNQSGRGGQQGNQKR